MKRYKLIKEYPGSPKLGEEFSLSHVPGYTFHNHYWIYNIGKDPEYWQEIVEKEYEILAFRSKVLTFARFILNKDKLYQHNTDHPMETRPLELNTCLKHPDLEIYSVKRLSDGEIFTIGNSINSKNWSNKSRNDVIESIFIAPKNYEDSFPTLKEGLIILKTVITWQTNLENATKTKQKLFTTEDGVDIYEGDKHYFIRYDFTLKETRAGKFDKSALCDPYNYLGDFSTKEKAEEYVILNKPCLSLKEVSQHTVIVNINKFQDLIKSKLNL